MRHEDLRKSNEGASFQSAAPSLINATRALDSSRKELEAAAVQDVLKLALLLTEKLTHRIAAIDPSVAVANVASAVRLVCSTNNVRIAIAPKDRAAVQDALPALKIQLPRLQSIELVDDPQLAPGGCKIFAAGGDIDASLETQLQLIVGDLLS